MIFRCEMVKKILAGEKTVTRRPVKFRDGVELPCRSKVGRRCALQPVRTEHPGKGRGGKSIGRLRVLSISREWLGGISREGEAQLEGFDNAVDFLAYWGRLYPGVQPDPFQLVDRIEFELISVRGAESHE